MYDKRSSQYDCSWHPIHASNYIQWTSPQPGDQVLDLACGTGLISLLAKRAVGPSGTVTGIDVSTGMLAIGKEKAQREHLDIEWLEWDICDLESAKAQGLLGETYDLITCATALVLLDDPQNAVRQWTTLLKPGGRIITDVPTETSLISGLVIEQVGAELNIKVPYYRRWVEGPDSLKNLFEYTGLAIEKAWKAGGYGVAEEMQVMGTPEMMFDRLTGLEVHAGFREKGVKEKAREVFVRKFHERGGGLGVKEEDALYVVIGRKVVDL